MSAYELAKGSREVRFEYKLMKEFIMGMLIVVIIAIGIFWRVDPTEISTGVMIYVLFIFILIALYFIPLRAHMQRQAGAIVISHRNAFFLCKKWNVPVTKDTVVWARKTRFAAGQLYLSKNPPYDCAIKYKEKGVYQQIDFLQWSLRYAHVAVPGGGKLLTLREVQEIAKFLGLRIQET